MQHEREHKRVHEQTKVRHSSHVHTLVKLLAAQQLGRHPRGGSCVGVRRLDVRDVGLDASQAEIANFAAEVVSHQQVVALEVSVHYGRRAAVQIQHSDCGVRGNLQFPLPVKVWTIGLHDVVQAASADEFSHDAELGRRGTCAQCYKKYVKEGRTMLQKIREGRV